MPVMETIDFEKVKTDEEFLSLALERFQGLYDDEFTNREKALENLQFVYNVETGQWAADIVAERAADKRPCLTFNKLRKYVAQVANHEREQRMAGRVRPVDDKADIKTAKVIEGIIRQIETASCADEIYAEAGEKAIAGGFGYWRIITKEIDDSFDQEVFIEGIDNQFSVYLDPERKFGFIREGISKNEFEFRYPKANMTGFESGIGEEYALWYEENKVFIAEYFYKEQYDKTIAQCINAAGKNQIIELDDEITEEILVENGFQILRKKTKKAEKVKWAKITAHEVLEKNDWVGKEIPIIEVVGDAVKIAGKTYKRGLVSDAKDPQRMYNYWLTHITESVALIPKSPYILTPQQIKGFEPMWNTANRKTHPYLLFNPIGSVKPQREPAPQLQAGSTALLQIADANISDTMGLYESTFGEKSNERTGIAIQKRQSASSFGIYHFHDNFRRAVSDCTRQLIDIIPKVYDTERQVRILGEDGNDEIVTINETVNNEATGTKSIVFDLTAGKYDSVADVRLFATRRQEAAQMMQETMQGAPNIAPLVLDLVFKYQDWPGADEIKARLEKYMPQLLGQKGGTTGETPGQTTTPLPTGGTP